VSEETQPYSRRFVADTIRILEQVPTSDVERIVEVLADTRARGGRLFFCGSGGGAGHASHAACDFRKLAAIESYSVSDNVSELTARINDEGWDGAYAAWLDISRLSALDCLFVFSVGGGDAERRISVNLVEAIELARARGASVVGIVGRDGGHLAKVADAAIVVPPLATADVTAQTEGLQALFWHLIVTHPRLRANTPKWESVAPV
jgi:D-sedoheptulose 7-phosphate isomerase